MKGIIAILAIQTIACVVGISKLNKTNKKLEELKEDNEAIKQRIYLSHRRLEDKIIKIDKNLKVADEAVKELNNAADKVVKEFTNLIRKEIFHLAFIGVKTK